MDSSSSLQKKNSYWPKTVKTFPQIASHAKKLTFEGTHKFQTTCLGKDIITLDSKVAYKSFTEKLRLCKFIHTILSSSAISTAFPCNLTNKSPTSSTSQSVVRSKGSNDHSPHVVPKDPLSKPFLQHMKQTKRGKKHTTVYPHTTYLSKTSPSFHYPP